MYAPPAPPYQLGPRSGKIPPAKKGVSMDTGLSRDLRDLLNRESRENESNTPDHILAEYLMACLIAFEDASNASERWYGVKLEPGQCIRRSSGEPIEKESE